MPSLHRLSVRTSDFQSGKTGSIPVGGTQNIGLNNPYGDRYTETELSPASYEGVQPDGDCSVVVTRYNSQQVV